MDTKLLNLLERAYHADCILDVLGMLRQNMSLLSVENYIETKEAEQGESAREWCQRHGFSFIETL